MLGHHQADGDFKTLGEAHLLSEPVFSDTQVKMLVSSNSMTL